MNEDEAIPQLSAADIALISDLGTRRQVVEGEYLYRAGDLTYDFYVVGTAEIDIVVAVDGGERVFVHHGPGRFLGELNMLSGLRVFVSARVTKSGEVIAVPRDRLRQLMATQPRLSDIILAAFIARRSLLLESAAPAIRVIGSKFSPESLGIREFLTRTRIPHEWLDSDADPQVENLLRQFSVAPSDLPVVIATGSVLRKCTPGELASFLGLTLENLPERCFDLVVVGGGPAGLAAAVYGASEGLRTLGVEMTAPGGQAGTSSRIENYLGFPMGISGTDLTQRAVVQAQKFGARLTVPCTAASISRPRRLPGPQPERRERGRGPGGRGGDRRRLPPPRRRPAARLRGERCLLRRDRDGGPSVQRRIGIRGRRGELGRPGGDLPGAEQLSCLHRHPWHRLGERHVELPRRPRGGRPGDLGAHRHHDCRARR